MIRHTSLASKVLDLIRFFAAFSVVIKHIGSVTDLAHHPAYHHDPLIYAYQDVLFNWSLTGYKFVMVFFVLSGLFISANVLKMIREDRWSWKMYLTSRLTRLWLVLIPALLLTLIWKLVQYHFFGTSSDWAPADLHWHDFVGNALFLQGIRGVHIFGNNGPLWSLSYEFWYYLMFPCMMLAFRAKTRNARIIYAALFVGMAWFVQIHIFLYYFIWLIGAVVLMVPKIVIKQRFGIPLLMLLIVLDERSMFNIYNTLASWHHIGSWLPDISVGAFVGATVYVILCMWNHKTASLRLFTELAGFSYTLYLVHYPLVMMLNAWITSPKWSFAYKDFYHLFAFVAIIILVYAWLIGKLTESNTAKVRRIVLNLLSRRVERIEAEKAPTV